MNSQRRLGLLAPAIILCACSAYPETEADFGNSARQMVRAQKVYTGPVDPAPVEGNDGQRLEPVLQAYRENVTQPEQADPPVLISLGQ